MISAVNGRKRALLTKSALEWHNKRCTAQSTLCVGNKKGKTELKAMCDFNFFFFFFFFFSIAILGSRYDTRTAQVSRYIDASMHRYALRYKCLQKSIEGKWNCKIVFNICSHLYALRSWKCNNTPNNPDTLDII